MSRQTVLFVDGDESVRRSVGRILSSHRDELDAFFAGSAREALMLLHTQPCDVIVADMTLPDMDGRDLMDQVRNAHPMTLRILVTEHAEGEAMFGLLRSAHQLLSKPCPAQAMVAAVFATSRLRFILMDRPVRQLVHRLSHLPVLPGVYRELTRELERPECSMHSLGDIISRDAGLSSGLLKMVNSPFFGLTRRVESPRQAVLMLGVSLIRGLVLHEKVFKPMDENRVPGLRLDRLCAHNLDVARCCRAVAQSMNLPGEVVENAFLAGLLHDAGKIVLSEVCPDEYVRVLELADSTGISVTAAEERVLGVGHAEVGGYLLGLWGFDVQVVAAIVYHHRPGRQDGASALTAVLHCTDAFLQEMVPETERGVPTPLDHDFLQAQGWSPYLDDWRGIVSRALHDHSRGE